MQVTMTVSIVLIILFVGLCLGITIYVLILYKRIKHQVSRADYMLDRFNIHVLNHDLMDQCSGKMER